jgi:RNA polymerase sigma factor (sigma-70 family)
MILKENEDTSPMDSSTITEELTSRDEDLARAIASGNREAECTFVERYLPPVRAMLLARSRNPELASDLQQDVIIEAICALRRGQLRDANKLAAFVSGIARNMLNNFFRSNRATEPLELPDNLPDLSCSHERAEEAEREAQANAAIASLEPLDRAILQLTLIEGLKPGLIAERLQMSPEVVRQRKLRATRRVIEIVRNRSQTPISHHKDAGRRP